MAEAAAAGWAILFPMQCQTGNLCSDAGAFLFIQWYWMKVGPAQNGPTERWSETHSDLGPQDLFILKGNIYELSKLCGTQVFDQWDMP